MKDEYLDGVKVFDYYVRAKERLVLEPISRVKFDDVRNRLYWLPAVFVEIKIDKHCYFITSRNSVDVMNRRRPTEWKCPRICHCLSLATFGYLGPSERWFNMVFTLSQRLCRISGIFIHTCVISGSLSPRNVLSSGCGWRNGLQIWRVAARSLNKQSRTADEGCFSNLGAGRGANNSTL